MAASAGSPRAFWKAWRASASPPMATASATITACSARSSRMAGSRNIPRIGCRFTNPWEFERPEVTYDICYGGWVETVAGARGPYALCLAPRGDDRGGRLRHAGGRLARRACQPAAAVVGARGRPAAARRVQPWRPCRGAARAGPRRGAVENPLPERRIRRPAANCACARNISSSPPRCRTSCSATAAPMARCIPWPSGRRSSSTTRIPASPSPS